MECNQHAKLEAIISRLEENIKLLDTKIDMIETTYSGIARLYVGNGKPSLELRMTNVERVINKWEKDFDEKKKSKTTIFNALTVGIILNSLGWIGTFIMLYFK